MSVWSRETSRGADTTSWWDRVERQEKEDNTARLPASCRRRPKVREWIREGERDVVIVSLVRENNMIRTVKMSHLMGMIRQVEMTNTSFVFQSN